MTNEENNFLAFTLLNESGMQVTILNYGGTIKTVVVPDRNGEMGDVVLGFDTNEEYEQKENPYFGCITGRFANRIAGGKFSIDGKPYQITVNDGENALHGGKVGLNRKFWDTEYDVNENILQLFYVSPHNDQGFPGSLTVAVTYTLTEENELQVNYKATTSAPTIINLTNHTYFNLSAGSDATVVWHEITIDAEKYIPVNDKFIPTGEI
ncbi:MAG: aldose epimerase family protein, partial [Flavitalea sp.]